jgi:hypothetical protein
MCGSGLQRLLATAAHVRRNISRISKEKREHREKPSHLGVARNITLTISVVTPAISNAWNEYATGVELPGAERLPVLVMITIAGKSATIMIIIALQTRKSRAHIPTDSRNDCLVVFGISPTVSLGRRNKSDFLNRLVELGERLKCWSVCILLTFRKFVLPHVWWYPFEV